MNPELVFSLAVFALLFFGLPLLCLNTGSYSFLWRNPYVYSLSLYGAGGALFYFGTVEMAGRYGLAGLLAFMIYAAIFIFSPLFLAPLGWISRSHSFASLPDLLIYRFRGLRVGQITSLTLALTSMPVAVAQFKAMAGAAGYLGIGDPVSTETRIMAVVALLVLIFIVSFGRPEQQKRVLPVVLAFGGVLALAALLLTGLETIYGVFGSYPKLSAWTQATGQAEVIQRFDLGYGLFLAFFATALIQPQLIHLRSLEHSDSRSIATASWTLPLALLLATLPMFPLLWGGLERQMDVPMQFYLTAIPSSLGSPMLLGLVLVAGWFICTGILVALTLALGRMLANNFYLPVKYKQYRQIDIKHWLPNSHIGVGTLWLLSCLLLAQITASESITDLNLVGMVGMVQLMPGLLGALYLPRINRRGFIAGLITGLLCWSLGFLVPLIAGDISIAIDSDRVINLGLAQWPFWLLEATLANLTVAILVSRFSHTSEEEQHFAHNTMVDSLPSPRKSSLELDSLNQARERLAVFLGSDSATAEINGALGRLQLKEGESRPLALRMLRDALSYRLSAQLGTHATDRILQRVMPLKTASETAFDDISLIETQLASSGSHLSGLAAELNKLRLYHRQTLENLPIGVCTLGHDGEIQLWNGAMEKNTGFRSDQIAGGNIRNMPPPWGPLLNDFAGSDDMTCFAIKISDPVSGNNSQRFNLHKSQLQVSSPLYAGTQVLLIENITERFVLFRELAHADRLAAVGRLAAGVAHEIGNPVTGIACLAQDVISETAEGEVKDMARLILDQTDRISSIVSTLINFSSSGDLTEHASIHRPVRIGKAAWDAIYLLQLDKRAKPVIFDNRLTDEIEVLGDFHQLTQVFVNLLDNARDASNANGVILIEARLNEPGWVNLTVTDQGTGIAEDILGRVMDPFVTTKEPGAGTGLGLSLVYRIISNHQGLVKIISPVVNGGGTRVQLRLPCP